MITAVDKTYLFRALHLAQKADRRTNLNPKVGAVLVCDNRIIGEGYHEVSGGPHAEVNCMNSVSPEHKSLVEQSTMYVTLEPCSHFGKTPPCSDLLIEKKVRRVVIGCEDPFPLVNGKGIQRLRSKGIQVDCLENNDTFEHLIAPFKTYHLLKRPYIMLKWAQSSDGYIGIEGVQVAISSPEVQMIVHDWRAEFEAIMVGTETVLTDNPQLTNRWSDLASPLRCIPDRNLRIPPTSRVFDKGAKTLIWNEKENRKDGHIEYARMDEFTPASLVADLYDRKIASVMIEGGRKLLQSFIDQEMWDEARVITSDIKLESGIRAPHLNGQLIGTYEYSSDRLSVIARRQ